VTRLGRIEFEPLLARKVLEESDHWHLQDDRVLGKLWAYGRIFVAADGPGEYGAQAVEALARSYFVAEPCLHFERFVGLMGQQGVPLPAAEAWARGARVTDDGIYLGWERPR
jgi:hypothetical protein